jgi:hypothetical protein
LKPGAKAPDVELEGLDGRPRSIRGIVGDGRVLLVFLRHLG